MSISPTQAAAAIEEIERTEARTRLARGYGEASPHLILWGLIWMVGYGACAVLPPARWGLIWLPLVLVGTAGSAWFGSRGRLGSRGRGDSASGALGRAALMAMAIGVFMFSAYFVFRPAEPAPYLLFPSLIAGLVYCLAGAMTRMARFIWIGGAIFVLTMAGYVAAPQWTAVWAALGGGGGLVLDGLWLRKV